MSIFLGNSVYLMGNYVCSYHLQEFFFQCKFWYRIFLQLDLNLELVPPVSTLGGCSVFTLGDGIGKSGRIICGPEGDIWKLRWKSVGMFPSSSSVMLGSFEGIVLARSGWTLWVIGADFVSVCCCGGFNVWCILAATLEKILIVAQSLPFGILRC